MPTQTPLTDQINALTTYANTVTGASDTNLSDAVATLADGYGGGGGISLDALSEGTQPSGDVTSNATVIKPYIFAFMSAMTSYSNPTITNNSNGANYSFTENTGLKTVDMPNLTNANSKSDGDHMFDGCTNLESVNLPKLAKIGAYFFQNCAKLTTLVFKNCGNVFTSAFIGCTRLTAVDFSGETNIYRTTVFKNCTNLTTLIIRRTGTVCPLNNTADFDGSPFASGGTGGTLYVPQSLISSYQSANRWSTILGYANNSITAIEGSIYETQYADGTPIE